jgi:TonB family protein
MELEVLSEIGHNRKRVATAVASLILSSCYSSTINTDAPQRANKTLADMEQGISSPYGSRTEQEVRLWKDKPEYVALAGAKHRKRIRMVSAVAPYYPISLRLTHVEATVVVSFVVGLDGRVEAARVIESSDSRFDAPAVDAMLKFTFLPAEGENGPEREMEEQPINFRIRKPTGQSTRS